MIKFNKKINIGVKEISNDAPVFIIAEAGVNHNGNMDSAFKLIDLAVTSGCDAVKFQMFKTESLILKNVDKALYQKASSDADQSQFDMLKRLELSVEKQKELKDYCKKKNIIFLTTPFDEDSLNELDRLDLDAYKISSTDVTNIPFIRKIASRGKPIILSSGMVYMNELEQVMQEINFINKDVILLQCTANYPIKDDEVNLNVLNTYKDKFDMLLGYSDHTSSIGAGPFAISFGISVIEKHFTLDKNLNGPDHKASLNYDELCEFVKIVRRVEKYMGTSIKCPTESEISNRKSLQKYLVASCNINEGSDFNEDNIVAKRTGGSGISPLDYRRVIGKKASRNFKKNEIIEI